MSGDTTVPHHNPFERIQTLRVHVIDGPDAGASHTAESDRITIGTAKDNNLVLTDKTVSRYHLELSHLGDGIRIVDLGSTNGSIAGSVRVERAVVEPGAQLALGTTQIRLEDGGPASRELHIADELVDLRGASPAMRELMARIKQAAKSDVSVLLLGETGVGKEVIARAIHSLSGRSDKPFETVDCASLSPTLVTSELFGHEKGAFTGADRQHVGAFERADGGTLFLDEIGELSEPLQASLLGALERRAFRRTGGHEPVSVDVRVVCATHRDLRERVNKGSFRQDLYYRIAVVLLQIPALRERVDDIPLLAEHFLREAGHSGPLTDVIPDADMRRAMAHSWPGNVRELRNFVEASLAMGEPPQLSGGGAPEPTGFSQALFGEAYKDARRIVLDQFENAYLRAVLDRCKGNVSQAARESGIHRSYFNRMLKRRGLR